MSLPLQDALYGHITLGLRKKSEFRELFNYHLLRMEGIGVKAKLRHDTLDQRKPKGGDVFEGSGQTEGLGFTNLFFPFAVFVIGAFGSVVLVGAETILIGLIHVSASMKQNVHD